MRIKRDNFELATWETLTVRYCYYYHSCNHHHHCYHPHPHHFTTNIITFSTSCSAGIEALFPGCGSSYKLLRGYSFSSIQPLFFKTKRLTFTKFAIRTFKLSLNYYVSHLFRGSQNSAVSLCLNYLLTS